MRDSAKEEAEGIQNIELACHCLALKVGRWPQVKEYGQLVAPTTKEQGPPSYNCKELNPASNLNEQESDSPLQPL